MKRNVGALDGSALPTIPNGGRFSLDTSSVCGDSDEMTRATSHLWDIIAYEVRMFSATYEIVLNPSALDELTKVLANAVEESAVLHTRILCDVFLSKAIGPDDIQLSRLFSDWHTDAKYNKVKEIIDDLSKRYGSAKKQGSYCWIFNKMMAHPTAHRGKSFDYTAILRGLGPVIQKIIAEIESLRGAPFTWVW
jgi:hypothetical protein